MSRSFLNELKSINVNKDQSLLSHIPSKMHFNVVEVEERQPLLSNVQIRIQKVS